MIFLTVPNMIPISPHNADKYFRMCRNTFAAKPVFENPPPSKKCGSIMRGSAWSSEGNLIVKSINDFLPTNPIVVLSNWFEKWITKKSLAAAVATAAAAWTLLPVESINRRGFASDNGPLSGRVDNDYYAYYAG